MKIISGCQTAADEGGLEAAFALGLETGGWVPLGCKTETGPRHDLARKYGLTETSSSDYPPRTELNVQNSDMTIWFGDSNSSGGRLTLRLADKHKKKVLVIDGTTPMPSIIIRSFLDLIKPDVINIAGNRESNALGIKDFTRETLVAALGCGNE